MSHLTTSVEQLVPRLEGAWYVVAWSHEVGATPLKRSLWGRPIVLWRAEDGTVGALVDRCPHRNVPLSLGSVQQDQLQCAYHGWRFDAQGHCRHIPALVGQADSDARRCPAFPIREQQGVIWLWGDPTTVPDREPFAFRHADDPEYLVVRRDVRASGSIHAVAENALDVPHTAFLHGGLFRNDEGRSRIQARVKRWDDRVECQYIGEARPEGLVGRLLSPSGGVVTHYDRFYLPSIVEVEYALGTEIHVLVNAVLSPCDAFDTKLFAVVMARTRFPAWLVKLVLTPIALRIFGQDAVILKAQTESLQRFGDARYASTELDALGPHILRLLKRAERGEPIDPGCEPYVRELEMDI